MKRIIVLIFAALFVFYVAWPAFSGYQIHQALEAQDTTELDRKIDFPSVRTSMRDPVVAHVRTRVDAVVDTYGPLKNLVGSRIPDETLQTLVDGALGDVVTADGLIRIYSTGGDVSAEVQRAVLKQINKMGGFTALFRRGGGATATGPGNAQERGQDPQGSSGGGGGGLLGGVELPGAVGDLIGSDAVGQVAGDVAGKVAGEIAGRIDAETLAKLLFPKLPNAGRHSPVSRAPGGGDDGSTLDVLKHVKTFGFAGPLGLQLGVAQSVAATEPDVTAQINFENYDWRVTKLTPNL